MEDELETIFSSFVFTLMAIKGLTPIADKVGLLDVPNHRKQHKGAVPLIGGLSIFLGVAISALLFMELDYQQNVLLSASLVIVVMGVFDDFCDLSVRLRFRALSNTAWRRARTCRSERPDRPDRVVISGVFS